MLIRVQSLIFLFHRQVLRIYQHHGLWISNYMFVLGLSHEVKDKLVLLMNINCTIKLDIKIVIINEAHSSLSWKSYLSTAGKPLLSLQLSETLRLFVTFISLLRFSLHQRFRNLNHLLSGYPQALLRSSERL